MKNTIANSSEKSVSWLKTLGAILPFVTFGLGLIFNEFPREWAISPLLQSLSGYLFIGTITFLPIGLCIGWIQGFPKWSYPYFGQFLLISLYLMGQPKPGFLTGKDLLGWGAWIPLVVVVVISLLVTRSLYSLKRFFTNCSADWTRLTFGMFGFMPLIIAIIFDEMDRLFSLYFMVILTFLIVGTAIAYLQSTNQSIQIRALVIGIFLTITIAVAGPSWYWFDRIKADFWPTVIAGIIIYLIMFSAALIRIIHKPVQTT